MSLVTKKNALGLVGAIALAVVGNAVWEMVRPGLAWTTSGVLDVATFGLATLRDSIYQNIAMGFHERASASLLAFATGLFGGAFLITGIAAIRRARRVSKNSESDVVDGTEEDTPKKNRSNYLWFTGFYLLAMFIYLMLNHARTIYIIRAGAHLTQMISIADPYLPVDQRIMVRADLAAMQNREDYVALEGKLAEIVKENGRPIPEFNIY